MAKNITKVKHRTPFRQLRQIPKLFARLWPVLSLLAVTLLIAYLNYEPGTFLTGWDNLHPEFSPFSNLKRAIFSVWQEYRGPGLLAGMAPAADIPRILLIILLGFLKIPTDLLRYLTTFLPLVIGPIGVYFLFYHHLFREKLDAKTTQFASFLGGLFYLLNLNTLQTFFVPFETFTWFYGLLPWLLFFVISYISKPSLKKLSTLFLVSLFSSPAFYVETIFLVFIVTIFPFLIEFFKQKKSHLHQIRIITISLFSLVTPHLFWLLPVVFFVVTGGHVVENAKINLISSPETYYRNLEFGNIKDLALMKGYLFNYLDLGPNYKYDYLLSVWRNHLSNPVVNIIGYLAFIIILTGLYYSLKKRFTWTASFISVLSLCFFFLLGGGLLINSSIPLVGELLRSPFTKFSIPLSLCYSFFFSIGTIFILDLFTYLHSRLTYLLTLFTITVALLIFMTPVFSGNLISSNMRQTIPPEYFDLFSFMKTQDFSGRIANFPQHQFWGWLYYDWGYRGSGFLWDGLKQPLLDRAFDVWEKTSEEYYEEISTALFSANQNQFEALIDKYQINWILLDKHVISPDGKTDLGNVTLERFLTSSSKFTLVKNFNDKIYLYKTDVDQTTKNFLSISDISNLKSEISYPFANLSLRPNTDWIEKSGLLSVTTPIDKCEISNGQCKISIPSLTDTENLLPIKVDYQKLGNNITFRLTPITPIIFVNKDQVDLASQSTLVTVPIDPTSTNFILQLNNQYFPFDLPAEITEFSDYFPITTVYLPTKANFTVSLFDNSESDSFSLTDILAQSTPTQCYIQKPNRKIEKIITPETISLFGTDVVGCLSTPLPDIPKNNLISFAFTYSSSTLTTGNVNLSGHDFNAAESSQPLEPSSTPKRARLFGSSTGSYQQINLLLEAEDTKSIQEITYRDIVVSVHPLLFSTTSTIFNIPEKVISLKDDPNYLQVSFPSTDTQFDIKQIAQSNSLFPEARNCDQFNNGKVVKQITPAGLLYQSQNAIECDQLNLRHLTHALNYLISFNYEYQKGLPLTTCLENYTTRRCDVFERLIDSVATQSLIQPITNSQEAPGYTLHLFNQSIGNRVTSNLLKSLVIRPIPLNFLQNIALTTTQSQSVIPGSDPESIQISPLSIISTTHPAEFLYTASINTNISVIPGADPESIQITPNTLNLYQTKSPYWQAIQVSEKDLQLPSWLITLKVLFSYPFLTKLPHDDSNTWHNSWLLPSPPLVIPAQAGIHPIQPISLVVIYLPQYLEFLGLALIPISLLLVIARFVLKPKQSPPQKKN